MRTIGKILLTTAAFGMSAAPVAAAAATPASKLSVTNAQQVRSGVRASAKAGDEKLLGGGVFVAVIAAIAVIVGIVIVANDDDSDSN